MPLRNATNGESVDGAGRRRIPSVTLPCSRSIPRNLGKVACKLSSSGSALWMPARSGSAIASRYSWPNRRRTKLPSDSSPSDFVGAPWIPRAPRARPASERRADWSRASGCWGASSERPGGRSTGRPSSQMAVGRSARVRGGAHPSIPSSRQRSRAHGLVVRMESGPSSIRKRPASCSSDSVRTAATRPFGGFEHHRREIGALLQQPPGDGQPGNAPTDDE